MTTPVEIYAAYDLMPILQLHQLRVAAVAKLILDASQEKLDSRNVLLATLFHDMGNIIKFKLELFPESRGEKGIDYWQKVQQDFVRRYGPDEHHATIAICHELHLPLQAVKYIDGVGYMKLEHSRRTPSMEQKIVEYSDLRVAPLGVVSLDERIDEARSRYVGSHPYRPEDAGRFEELRGEAHEIERQIFEKCRLKPEDITEETVTPVIEELKQYKIS